MFKRKAYDKLSRWKNDSNGSTALLVEGARRVGKSTLVEEFGRNEYESCIVVDFSVAPRDVFSYFEEMRNDLDTFFLYLSAFYEKRLVERNTLIVFDEVQEYPRARELIKQLVADGRYDYIETGSLASVQENVADILIPSEERSMNLDPFDFDEFLWAMGQEPLVEVVARAFEKREPLPDALHKKASRLFREYMLVGGMPQAVAEYVDTRDFGKVDEVKRDILRLYRSDIAKHAGRYRHRVTAVFDALPGQLSRHEKKFTLSSLGKSARMRDYEDAFFWLADARITNDCFNSTAPNVGLGMSIESSSVKCYMADTGLLVSHAFADKDSTSDGVYRDILLDKLEIKEGMLAENVVAQLLHAAGHRLFFFTKYDEKAKRSMEIDFLITAPYANAAMKTRVSPIEVKSARSHGLKSLDSLKIAFGKKIGTEYVLRPGQMHADGDRLFLPIYMAGNL